MICLSNFSIHRYRIRKILIIRYIAYITVYLQYTVDIHQKIVKVKLKIFLSGNDYTTDNKKLGDEFIISPHI